MMEQFRVATLNIWNSSGEWDRRLKALRNQLGELKPDIIGMQEVLRSSALDQAAQIAHDMGYYIAWGRASGIGGNAVLSRWPIRRSEGMTLPHCGSGEYRGVVYAEIEAPYGIQPFYCTHLNWKLDHGPLRQRQVRALVDFVDRCSPRKDQVPHGWTGLNPSSLGVFDADADEAERKGAASVEAMAAPIVVGDFNAEPTSDEIRFMVGWTGLGGEGVYFRDCYAAVGDLSCGATYTYRNPYTRSAGEVDRRIDYIFIRGSAEVSGRGRVLRSQVCFDREEDGVFPTDHFGVLADIGL